METAQWIRECNEVYCCQYCNKSIKGTFNWQGGGIRSKEALDRHENECEKNPNSEKAKLLRDIAKCQTEARIVECLNCKHYQNKCSGTKK